MPFWATENYTSVTKIRSTISFESFKKYYLDFILSRFYNGKLSFGSLPQGYGGNRLCPNPCLNTKVYFSVWLGAKPETYVTITLIKFCNKRFQKENSQND